MASLRNVNLTQPLGGLLREKKRKFTDDEASAILFGLTRPNNQQQIVQDRQQRLWYLCIAFYLGHQRRMDLDAVALMTDWLEPSRDEQLYVANHIAPLVSRQVSRLMQSHGQFMHIPATPDFRDQRGAKAGSHFLDYWYDELKLRDVRREIAMWMTLAGTGFSYVDWDERSGQRHRFYRSPFNEDEILPSDSVSDPQRQLLESLGFMEEHAEGDMFASACSPFEIGYPQMYSDLESMPWLRIDKIRSYDWLYDRFGSKASEIPPESFSGPAHRVFFRQISGLASGSAMSNDLRHIENAVSVSEFWRPPCALMPQGALLIGAGGVILHNGPHPSSERNLDIRFPVDRARYQPIPHQFMGQGMVQHLLDPSMEYNRSRTQIIQQRDILSHAQWSGTRVPTRLRNDYGDFWVVEAGHSIQLHNPPALSQAHIETKEAAKYDMQVLSAQSEASQGQNPAGVRSGNALLALQEKDIETVGFAFEEMESCMEGQATKILKLTARLLTMPRAVAIYGKTYMSDVVYLKGADLRGNTKVRVIRGSMRPKSEAALRETVAQFLQSGALDMADPETRRYVYKVFEFHDLQAGLVSRDLIERRAEAENEAFANPQIDTMTGVHLGWPGVEPHDDDILHIQVHGRFMQTDEYEQLPADQKMALQAHKFLHEQKVAKLLMLQTSMQPQPQGSPPRETGKPSQPKAQPQTASP